MVVFRDKYYTEEEEEEVVVVGTRGNIRDEEILLKPYLLMKCLISAKSPGDLREISRGGN